MSWIFGACSFAPAGLPPDDYASHEAPLPELYTITTAHVMFSLGGLRATCRWGTLHTHDYDSWVVVGTGLLTTASGVSILDDAAWTKLLSAESPDLRHLDGHFIALRWGDKNLEAYTDALGLRSLYIARTADTLFLSSRPDWLARVSSSVRLDPHLLGGFWRSFNQYSTESLLANTERIGPGGRLVVKGAQHTVQQRSWSVEGDAIGVDAMAILGALLKQHGSAVGDTISLGLSGGLDSRLLLSLLPRSSRRVHAFGHSEHPDVALSATIATDLAIPHVMYPPISLEPEQVPQLFESYCRETSATTPASTALRMQAYTALQENGYLVIDGGFGEIGRAQFMGRLRFQPFPRPAEDLAHRLRVHRADVFIPEVDQAMHAGLVDELASTLLASSAEDTNEGNRFDVFACRSRLPNFYGVEQARLDGLVQNYMPFAQPSFLRAMLSAPMRQRHQGRLYKRTIRSRDPRLARYPLVKGTMQYPFWLPVIGATLWHRAMKRFRRSASTPIHPHPLQTYAEYVGDLLRSKTVREHPWYSHAKLDALHTRFEQGDHLAAVELDWWLSFELWRQGIEEPA